MKLRFNHFLKDKADKLNLKLGPLACASPCCQWGDRVSWEQEAYNYEVKVLLLTICHRFQHCVNIVEL